MGALGGGAAATVVLIQSLGAGADKKKFVDGLFAVVTQELPQVPVAGRVLIVAHAAYESGWGQLENARANTNNIFNVTAGKSWRGPTSKGTDTENGKPIVQVWRKYSSINEAVRDYWSFLGTLYPAARQELMNSPVSLSQFCAQLRARGYFTLDLASYVAGMTKRRDEAAKLLNVTV